MAAQQPAQQPERQPLRPPLALGDVLQSAVLRLAGLWTLVALVAFVVTRAVLDVRDVAPSAESPSSLVMEAMLAAPAKHAPSGGSSSGSGEGLSTLLSPAPLAPEPLPGGRIPAAPLEAGFHAAMTPRLAFIQSTLAAHHVNGTVLFTCLQLENGSGYLDMVKNWVKGVERSLPQFAGSRLIVGGDALTCGVLTSAGINGCVADIWPWAGRGGGMDPGVRLKWLWAQAGLTLGYKMFFTDADVFFTGEPGLFEYLTVRPAQIGAIEGRQAPRSRGSGSGGSGSGSDPEAEAAAAAVEAEAAAAVLADAIGPTNWDKTGTMPDLQIMSDILRSTSGSSRSCRGAEGRDIAALSVATTYSWVNQTLDRWYGPHPEGPPLNCNDCPLQWLYAAPAYAKDVCTCVSTGFWFAMPTAASLRLFNLMVTELEDAPTFWEQRKFNLILPLMFPRSVTTGEEGEGGNTQTSIVGAPAQAPYDLLPRVVVIDTRAVGNSVAWDCVARFPDLLDSPANPRPPRYVVHPGYYTKLEEKIEIARSQGLWLLDGP